ncbi:Cold shock protein, CspA family [Quadrisphaera granulorum]|uniref:Cold shock CspA family protein n=1 Tax=Quadrisphaera granulorum TaxID=317664 RepID=A0A316AWM5_9ACTN|nr:hypothetical protein [Quadrisphaera granulorum]PWJ54567.1 cold shock CspA family protein [Quadrisphaera granulorum]SZE95929.1 Cold shock protein, CspA family [Quadrisphaera granulorum]
MKQRSITVDGLQVSVSALPDDAVTYELRWVVNGQQRTVTVANADGSPPGKDQLVSAVRALSPAEVPQLPAGRASGVVRVWHDEEGWGVIDAPQTPGGCWAHFSVVLVEGYASLTAGQCVELEWEAARQDGYDFRATSAWPAGHSPVERTAATDAHGGAYSTSLMLTFDTPTTAVEQP